MNFRRPFTSLLIWAGLVVLLSATVACGSGDTTEAAVDEQTEESSASESLERPTLPEDTDPDIAMFEDFEAATFSNPTVIDNAYLPYLPGNRIVLSGTTVEDGEEFSHQIRYIVTDLTKEILGVQTVVVWIEDYSD
ncbi:MAG: hypothetical protein OEZ14_08410, partial [Acidimicrobiia bacterium]|nr:hypothetical protein [Acidimicrobiia bacterium]